MEFLSSKASKRGMRLCGCILLTTQLIVEIKAFRLVNYCTISFFKYSLGSDCNTEALPLKKKRQQSNKKMATKRFLDVLESEVLSRNEKRVVIILETTRKRVILLAWWRTLSQELFDNNYFASVEKARGRSWRVDTTTVLVE